MSGVQHRAALTIGIVAFVVLVLELTTTRLYAYIGSAHATSTALSIALLGLGVGAALRARVPALAADQVSLGFAASLALLGATAIAGAGLWLLAGLSLVPFALAGALIAEAYAARGPAAARATYAIDLGAAALGCVIAPRLLGPLSPMEIMVSLGALACGLAWVRGGRRAPSVAIAAACAALLILGRLGELPDGPLGVLLASDPQSEKAIASTPTNPGDILDSAWSPLGRLDVRGLPDERTDRLGVFTDGMSPTYLVAQGHTIDDSWGFLMALPYRALRPSRVLVLGAGAGASVALATQAGATAVDAVEVNPAIPDLLARWRHFTGDVYHQPGVRLVTADARRFLADTTERYDLIELALALTGNAHADQPSGMEAHLYTVEAVKLYLRHLTPTGALVLIHSDPGNAYRQLRTVLEALGGERALDGIAVLHDPRPGTAYRFLLVVRATPMPLALVDALDVEPAELLWGPGDPPERATELLDPARLGATGRDDLAPVHDDRPYFFQNTQGLVATALAEPGRLWVLGGALLVIAVLVAERGRVGARRPTAVAACLGAAFLTVELVLIQRFTLAAGGTLYAVSFVVFCLLAWSATGALLLGAHWRRHPRGVTGAALAASIAVIGTALLVRDVAWLDGIASDPARLLLVATLLAPIGLALGGPFPTLLAQHGDERLGTLWAVNGVAAVAGGVVAVLALRVGGATHALLVAAVLYALAAGLAPTATRR